MNKDISNIGYNCLNLPNWVIFTGGNSIEYEYGADGTKLRTLYKMGSTTLTTDYCGNAVYENGVLKMLLNEAGYVSFPDKKFHFYLEDHQGNTRVVVDKDGNVEETNTYYPFGGTFTTTASVQPYKYNGKELDLKNGLNWYDYGARHYDAAIGRWHVVDPSAEKYSFVSHYAYCLNNPMKFIDPIGKDVVITGELSDEALKQLQDKAGKSITLSKADDGVISYKANTDKKLKSDAKKIAGMINDHSITVNLITTDTGITSDGNLFAGGAFMGNTVTLSNTGEAKVTANQEINPNLLGSADEHTQTPGKMIMHELTEAYEGARISQSRGISSPKANMPGSVFLDAHNRATPQTIVYRVNYDKNNKETQDSSKATRVEWYVLKDGNKKVIQVLH